MRLTSIALRDWLSFLAILIVCSLVSGCSIFGSGGQPPPSQAQLGDQSNIGPLQVGDGIEVDFSGSPSPMQPVRTEIKGDGTVHFEFIGDIQCAGKTPGQLERVIQGAYVPAYYTHLSVTVTPSGRYFFVDGEVATPVGRCLYSGPITVTRAIAAGGGFSPFADKRHVKLFRVGAKKAIVINCVKALDHPELDVPVYPGDRIYIPRRYY